MHNVMKISNAEVLAMERITPNGSIPLMWANGFVFAMQTLPPNETQSNEILKGNMHWIELHFAELKTFSPLIQIADGKYQIGVFDISNSPIGELVSKFLEGYNEGKFGF